MAAGIDRSSGLPFYYQLKQLLLRQIRDDHLAPGDRLPSDHELCDRYDISRTVVRQALAELETEGVLERVKGRGTFVAPQRTGEHLVQSLTGLFEDVESRGSHLRSEVRRREVVPADELVAADLGIEVGAPVIVIERLRFVDDEPWVVVTAQLPYALAPGLLEEDLTDRSLYAVLEQEYGVLLLRGRRTVEAALANAEVGRALGIDEGQPVLVLRSVVTGPERPVESFVAYHRGDRSRFEVTLDRSPLAPSALEPLMHVLG